MARTSSALQVCVLGVCLGLVACVDTGVIGHHCDSQCVQAPCASGLPACGGSCGGDQDCAGLSTRTVCDQDRAICVECTRSGQCTGDDDCRDGLCVPDLDDDSDEGDASD